MPYVKSVKVVCRERLLSLGCEAQTQKGDPRIRWATMDPSHNRCPVVHTSPPYPKGSVFEEEVLPFLRHCLSV